jgi:endonuclease YncB( thermonuclease family)
MKFTALSLLLLSGSSYGTDDYGKVQVTKIWSVYDGDTIKVDIADWPDIVGKKISVRVVGIDTPEMRGKCEQEKRLARAARDAAKRFLTDGQTVELHSVQRGKYFRLLAEVMVDGHSLGASLIENKLARPYSGGTRKSWCIAK